MARARLLSRTLGASRKFASAGQAGKLGEFAQLLYTLIIPHTDDFGRMAGDAFTVKHAVFPTSKRREGDFETALQYLAESGLIQLYAVDGQSVLQITDFERHQGNLHKRTSSHFPEPPGTSGNIPELPEIPGSRARKIDSVPVSVRSDLQGESEGALVGPDEIEMGWAEEERKVTGVRGVRPGVDQYQALIQLVERYRTADAVWRAARVMWKAKGRTMTCNPKLLLSMAPQIDLHLRDHGDDVPFGESSTKAVGASRNTASNAENLARFASRGSK
jgi:hypothetical protein